MTQDTIDLYDQLRRAGCDLDNHESDLYVRSTPTARELVSRSGRTFSYFKSQVDGRTWIDVPFAFTPWWQARAKA